MIIGSDGNAYGPVDIPTIVRWATEGRVIAGTVLVDIRTSQQITAQQVPELSRLFTSNIPVIPVIPVAPFLPILAPPKSKSTAILLALFLGSFGAHRYYLGRNGSATAMLVLTLLTPITCISFIVVSIWATIDLFLIASDSLPDAQGITPR